MANKPWDKISSIDRRLTGKIGRNRWSVKSETKENTYYEVRLRTKLDELGSMYFQWECNCPSYKYPCKHISAVENESQAIDDQAGERIEW